MSDKHYLRPVCFLWGKAAKVALASGYAIPVAGGPAACTAFEVIQGTPRYADRRIVAARDLAASTDPQITETLSRISTPRAPLAGLTFDRPLIMGVVNVTPDSFSDGGDFDTTQKALAQVRRIAQEGADLFDIGGESTRPGAARVDEEAELRRVLPVIGGFPELPQPISIDTRKACVMEAAVLAGAAIINDVSALTHDEDALETAARLQKPVVLMHAQGDPRTMQDAPTYDDVLLEVYDYLEDRIEAAVQAGLPREKLIADPGIGFGKTLVHNLALLGGISLFHGLGVPVLVGVSRKRSIGELTGEKDPKMRVSGSIGAALAAAAQGVQIFRVHDVRETVQAMTCWHAAVTAS